ncbi:MAG: type I restriction enzyme HsdR N-terminal domain-containing protein [Caldisericia bacterium]|nr:type I restriction enzyme HsdR N-terminal domain-containing protein [Caldisericia bacterium]
MKNLSFIENDAFREWNRLIQDYKNAESQLKSVTLEKQILIQEYIKPFFHLLGWSENKKNALHLTRIDPQATPGKPNPPDYLLINKHKPLFFIDIKKPAFPIKEQKERAFQLRRFSFSANLPIAVSTDFEEFALFDCRIKPELNDNLELSRLFYCDIDSLFSPCELVPGVRNIDFLFSVFSSTALSGNQFHRFIEEMPSPSYKTNVNHELDKMTDTWHFTLFKELSALNPDFSKHTLSELTSHFIFTLLYWRFLEDTNQEKYATLYQVSLMEDPWKSLRSLWKKKNHIWQSDLPLLPSLQIGKEALYSILQQLYYPSSPFEFSVIPPPSYLQVFSSLETMTQGETAKSMEPGRKLQKREHTMFSSIVDELIQSKLLTLHRKRIPPWLPIWHLDPIWSNLFSTILNKTNLRWKLDYSIAPSLSPDLEWIKSWFPPLPDLPVSSQKECFIYIPYQENSPLEDSLANIRNRIQSRMPYLQRVVLLFELHWTTRQAFQDFWKHWTNFLFPKTIHLYQQSKKGFLLAFLYPERRPKQILFSKHLINEHFQITQTILQPISLDSLWKTTPSD